MSIEELQLISSIAGDITTVTLVIVAIVWTERRRIYIADKVIEDWNDLREMFKDKMRNS